MEMWCYLNLEDKKTTRLVQSGCFFVEKEEDYSEDGTREVTNKANIAGESDGYIDEEEYHRTAVLGIVAGFEFEGDIGEDCHGESADPNRIGTREEEESYPDEDGIAEEEEDILLSSNEGFDLIPEYEEEETIHREVENTTVEELIEEELKNNTEIGSLQKEKWMHPVIQDRRQKERDYRHDTGGKYKEIRNSFIMHTFGFWKRKGKRLRKQSSGYSEVVP